MASEFETLKAIKANNNLNPVQATRLKELEATGAVGNPQGIESPTGSFIAPVQQATPAIAGATTGFNQPTIDLNALYEKNYQSSGIKELTDRLTTSEQQYLQARNKISDNPFLDASTLDKRLMRLKGKFEEESKPVQDKIALQQADVQNRLNIASKQFDINSQQAQLALNQFNSLVGAGAFDNADASSIAQAATATGLSTSMIQSIIQARAKANTPEVKTQVISYDDGTNQGYAVINSQTGEVINRQVVAESKPLKATQGDTKESEKQQNIASLTTDIKNKVTLKQLVGYYGQVLSIDDIYRLYNIYSPYGAAKEDIEDVKSGKFVS